MKIILLFLMFMSTAFAQNDEILSQRISHELQKELSELPPGNYQLSSMGTYITSMNTSLPVFLSSLMVYELPEDLQSCDANEDSHSCQIARYVTNWYEMNQPVAGKLEIKTIVFENGPTFPRQLLKVITFRVNVN